jgi:hypothetical protein
VAKHNLHTYLCNCLSFNDDGISMAGDTAVVNWTGTVVPLSQARAAAVWTTASSAWRAGKVAVAAVCTFDRSGMGWEGARLGAVSYPLCPGLPPSPVTCSPLLAGWQSSGLAWCRRGSDRSNQWQFVGKGQLFNTATQLI